MVSLALTANQLNLKQGVQHKSKRVFEYSFKVKGILGWMMIYF